MKRFSYILAILLACSVAIAGQLKPYAFPFIGRWQPSDPGILIDDYGFQDIQNLRKDGKNLRGVSGHTAINTAVISDYTDILNGFHYSKDQPSETHLLVYAVDSAGNKRVFQNTTAIPEQGDFSATSLYTPGGLVRFSDAPQGDLIACDGAQSSIWGGDQRRVSAFITSSQSVIYTITSAKDYHTNVENTSTSKVGVIDTTANGHWLVGASRPIQGVYYTVSSVSLGSPTMTGWQFTGSDWESLVLTDGTSGLTQSGEVTFDSTVSTSKPLFLDGSILYWYQFALDSGSAQISNVTVNAPWQEIKNIWDNAEVSLAAYKKYDGTTYQTYTDEVNAPEGGSGYVAVLDSLGTAHYVVMAYVDPLQGVNIRMEPGKENGNAAELVVSYWNGSAWATVSNLRDNTAEGGASLGKTGTVVWSEAEDLTEFATTIGDETPLYYYKFAYSGALDAEVEVRQVTAIPATDDVPAYKFGGLFQERAFLFCEEGGDKNKARYSAYNSPDVWNGDDAGVLYFGDAKELTAAAVIYNVFQATGFDQLLVTKKHETWRVTGDAPDTWVVKQMSSNIGCVAPLTMAVCEIAEVEEDVKRHVAIWQTDHSVVMCDGARIQPISDDIRCYFDPNDDRAIPAGRIDDSVGWFDPVLGVYKLLISSGSGQSTHNVELEYSLEYNEWTKIKRENGDGDNPLQSGWLAHDTDGNAYSFGGTDEGAVYRLENGSTWNGTAITQYVWTKDLLLDDQVPLMRHSNIQNIRLMFETKEGSGYSALLTEDGGYLLQENGEKIIVHWGEYLNIGHYCEGVATVTGDDGQFLPESTSMEDGPFETYDTELGECLMHSLKVSAEISTITDGIELHGMGLYFENFDTIMED